MDKKRHKHDTAEFDELTYAEQAKSINAHLLVLKRLIKANRTRAKKEGKPDPTAKRIENLEKMAAELKGLKPF